MKLHLVSSYACAMLFASVFQVHAQSPARATGKLDPKVFESAPATMAPDIFGNRQKTGGVLRVLTVDERTGYARKNELVRVPVFFHAGEAASDPNSYAIVPAGGGNPIPFQADDIRRDTSGKIARMHLYFFIDSLPAWGRRQFNLQPGKNPGAGMSALPVTEANGTVTFAGDDIKVSFHSKGEQAGAISSLETSVGKVNLPDHSLSPEAAIFRQGPDLKAVRENRIMYREPGSLNVKSLRWASGPIFAKVELQITPKDVPDDIAEYIFLIPKYGAELVETQIFYPEGDVRDTVGAKSNAFLTGKLFLGDSAADQELIDVPAGLRRELRTVFNYSNEVLVNKKAGISMAMIPYMQKGGNDVGVEDDGRAFFCGSSDFQTKGGSNSGSLRAFWGQARFIFSKATDLESLWQQSCKGFQPLTAVVDEPWATPDDLFALAKEVNKEYWKIQNWGRSFEANLVMDYLSDKDVAKALKPSGNAPDLRSMIPTQEEIDAAAKKGQGAGGLDPYGITYSFSAIVPFSAFIQPSEKLDVMAAMKGQASRLVNGGITKNGWPHVRSFANAANMHIGTYLCGIWGGAKTGNKDLVQWSRDAATSQNYRAAYGHAQRPYSMNEGGGDASDVLYISITDFWLRAIELACNEDLSIHPAVYGRYFDMIDVNSDIYQRRFPVLNKETKEVSTTSEPTWYRATFFRGQAHDHRWEAYGCDPFLGMLGKASDQGRVGVTEACYYMHRGVGRPQTWNGLMTDVFFPAIFGTKGLANYQPPKLPALPANVQAQANGNKMIVTWDAVPDAAGYRVYRAGHMGGPWTWVNSPYPKMEKFKAPSNARKEEAKAAAEAEDGAKAASAGVEPKKLKKDDKTPSWSKMPPIEVPPIPNTLITGTRFEDPDGTADDVYFVTAQDKNGRESDWFINEPAPVPSKK